MIKRIGFFINPIAGMGGQVALKGTDGSHILSKAKELGAKPVTPARAKVFLEALLRDSTLTDFIDKIIFYIPLGSMGGDLFTALPIKVEVFDLSLPEQTTAKDTEQVIQKFEELNVELIVFVGGDGTSVDIMKAQHQNIPVLSIPGGVKTYGSVFTHSPYEAVSVLSHFISNNQIRQAEVLDLNEDAYRKGTIEVQLLGYLTIPDIPRYFQLAKEPSLIQESESEILKRIAEELVEQLDRYNGNNLIILGPGSTFRAFANLISFKRSILGVDCFVYQSGVKNIQVLQLDAREDQIFTLIHQYTTKKIIITPIGGQGYIFGRGNHQISARIIHAVGKENILVAATPQKLQSIQNGVLRVDTRDSDIDNQLIGYIKVITDRDEMKMVKIVR